MESQKQDYWFKTRKYFLKFSVTIAKLPSQSQVGSQGHVSSQGVDPLFHWGSLCAGIPNSAHDWLKLTVSTLKVFVTFLVTRSLYGTLHTVCVVFCKCLQSLPIYYQFAFYVFNLISMSDPSPKDIQSSTILSVVLWNLFLVVS